ncbi:leucine aminopeptidase family protein [Salix suchowensis]|nr:leucine aminopeptidase family protein [Salix suchowensis]
MAVTLQLASFPCCAIIAPAAGNSIAVLQQNDEYLASLLADGERDVDVLKGAETSCSKEGESQNKMLEGELSIGHRREKDMTKDDSKRFENSLLKNLDTKLGSHLSEASSEEDFTGKLGQSMVLRVPGHGAKRIDFIGLGKSAANAFRNFGEAIAAVAKNAQASNVGIVLASTRSTSNESKLNIASTIASGTVLGTSEDNKFKSDSNKPVLKSVDILGFGLVLS